MTIAKSIRKHERERFLDVFVRDLIVCARAPIRTQGTSMAIGSSSTYNTYGFILLEAGCMTAIHMLGSSRLWRSRMREGRGQRWVFWAFD